MLKDLEKCLKHRKSYGKGFLFLRGSIPNIGTEHIPNIDNGNWD